MAEKEKKVVTVPDIPNPPAQPVLPFAELTARVAGDFAIEPKALWDALKTEFFPGGAASDAQMFLVLQMIDKYQLNPFMHEMFASVSKKTGKLLVGVQYDGFIRKALEHPHYKGYQFEYIREQGKVVAIICKVYRDDWEHPGEYYADMAEWNIQNETWVQQPIHKLAIKAFNNAVRLTLGLGFHDPDDIDRMQVNENRPAIETTAARSEPEPKVQAVPDVVVTNDSGEGEREVEGARAQQVNGKVHDELAKLIERTPPARINLLLGQQGVARIEDLNDEQVAAVVARLSKGAK